MGENSVTHSGGGGDAANSAETVDVPGGGWGGRYSYILMPASYGITYFKNLIINRHNLSSVLISHMKDFLSFYLPKTNFLFKVVLWSKILVTRSNEVSFCFMNIFVNRLNHL